MKLTHLFIAAVAAIASFTAVAANHNKIDTQSKAAKLVLKVTQNRFTIQNSFPSIGNLQGFVIKPTTGDQSTVAYADKDGRYMVVGAVINPQGQSVSQDDYDKYVQSKVAAKAIVAAKDTAWFWIGNKKAKHQFYVLAEPNCSVCHMLYQELQPYLKSGDIGVRWILVHFIKPDSKAKAAAILQAKDSAKALSVDETRFVMQTETGGIAPAKSITPVTEKKLQNNMAFMKKYGFNATPTIIYKDKGGKAQIVQGLLRGKSLKQFLDKIGAITNSS